MEAAGLASVGLAEQPGPLEDGLILEPDTDQPEAVFNIGTEQVGGDQAAAVAEQQIPARAKGQNPEQSQIADKPQGRFGVNAARQVARVHAPSWRRKE